MLDNCTVVYIFFFLQKKKIYVQIASFCLKSCEIESLKSQTKQSDDCLLVPKLYCICIQSVYYSIVTIHCIVCILYSGIIKILSILKWSKIQNIFQIKSQQKKKEAEFRGSHFLLLLLYQCDLDFEYQTWTYHRPSETLFINLTRFFCCFCLQIFFFFFGIHELIVYVCVRTHTQS